MTTLPTAPRRLFYLLLVATSLSLVSCGVRAQQQTEPAKNPTQEADLFARARDLFANANQTAVLQALTQLSQTQNKAVDVKPTRTNVTVLPRWLNRVLPNGLVRSEKWQRRIVEIRNEYPWLPPVLRLVAAVHLAVALMFSLMQVPIMFGLLLVASGILFIGSSVMRRGANDAAFLAGNTTRVMTDEEALKRQSELRESLAKLLKVGASVVPLVEEAGLNESDITGADENAAPGIQDDNGTVRLAPDASAVTIAESVFSMDSSFLEAINLLPSAAMNATTTAARTPTVADISICHESIQTSVSNSVKGRLRTFMRMTIDKLKVKLVRLHDWLSSVKSRVMRNIPEGIRNLLKRIRETLSEWKDRLRYRWHQFINREVDAVMRTAKPELDQEFKALCTMEYTPKHT